MQLPVASQLAPRSRGPPMLWHREFSGGGSLSPAMAEPAIKVAPTPSAAVISDFLVSLSFQSPCLKLVERMSVPVGLACLTRRPRVPSVATARCQTRNRGAIPQKGNLPYRGDSHWNSSRLRHRQQQWKVCVRNCRGADARPRQEAPARRVREARRASPRAGCPARVVGYRVTAEPVGQDAAAADTHVPDRILAGPSSCKAPSRSP